jgi:TPR repeat protein
MRKSSYQPLALVVVVVLSCDLAAQDATDVQRAFATVRTRATRGDVIAQFTLGSMLYYGSDETVQAVDWFRKAAAKDFAPAEFQMGQLYDFGFGVPKDDKRALEWYVKAAQHGSAPAARAVGEFYRRGRSVKADAAQALRWYRQAADGDDLRAQYQLAQMYFDGTGVARDYVTAYMWFDVAAGQTPLVDNQKALLELRNIAAARMAPEALAEAERRARSWKPAVQR